MSWIKIERHNMVKFKNSPDDPTLKEYWEKRDRKVFDTENTMDRMKLARKQGYRCAICKNSTTKRGKGSRKRHACSATPHIV